MTLKFPVERRALRSWKDISAFLEVTPRTAQRWEAQQGLPVHRIGSGRNARVVAYTDELTSWLESEDPDRRGAQVPTQTPVQVLEWPAPSKPARQHRPWIWIVAGVLAGFGVVGLHLLLGGPGPAVSWRFEGFWFRTLDAKAHVCWEKRLAGIRLRAYAPDGGLVLASGVPGDYDGVLQEDIDGDGIREWLINYVPQTADESRGKLLCFEQDGRLRWQFPFGAAQAWRGRSLSANYNGLLIRPVVAQGKQYLLTVSVHAIWFPSQVALLDPGSGRVLGEYWHPGGLFICRIHDIDRDGSPEALLAGVNNPGDGLGHAALVVLDLPFSKASPVEPRTTAADFWNSTGVKELGYVLFPRSDTYDAVGVPPVASALAILAGERLLVRLDRFGGGTFFYYLNRSLELVECRISEGVIASHRQLTATRLLDHDWSEAEAQSLNRIVRFPTAPDGNSQEVTARFNAPR